MPPDRMEVGKRKKVLLQSYLTCTGKGEKLSFLVFLHFPSRVKCTPSPNFTKLKTTHQTAEKKEKKKCENELTLDVHRSLLHFLLSTVFLTHKRKNDK
jgi:hypothetical protein